VSGVTGCVLDGFTVQNGRGTLTSVGYYDGGGVYVTNASMTIARCDFRNNDLNAEAATHKGEGGGVMASHAGDVVIADSVFEANQAYQGGGIAVFFGPCSVLRCRFTGNNAINGGGLFAGSGVTLNVADGTFAANTGTRGAGFFAGGPGTNVAITQTRISGNNAAEGGGCYISNVAFASVVRCIFTDNASNSGTGGAASTAGPLLFGSNLLVRNVSHASNSHGGGIDASGGQVVNNTFVASVGDAIYASGSCNVANNLVLQTSGNGIDTASGVPLRNNCVWGSTGLDYGAGAPPAGNISTDPRLMDLANGDNRLRADSPCRDAGSTPDAQALSNDYEGQSRVFGTAVDIGADEFAPYLVFRAFPTNTQIGAPLNPQPVVAVAGPDGAPFPDAAGPVTISIGSGPSGAGLHGTTTAPVLDGVATFTDLSIDTFGQYTLAAGGSGYLAVPSPPFGVLLARCYVRPDGDDANLGDTWATARRTLASALSATAGPDGEVRVAAGSYTEHLAVPVGVTLYGGYVGTGANPDNRNLRVKTSVINANAQGPCVRFNGDGGIDNFSLTGGIGYLVREIGGIGHREGGAIYVEAGSPRITNNLIYGNTAVYGGGIAALAGRPDVRYNMIAQNTAVAAGTLFGAGGALIVSRGVIMADNVIFDNEAAGASSGNTSSVGGAIVVGGSADVHNNTIVANLSPAGRGDIFITGGSPHFSNNIITNRAGIELAGGTPVFTHNDYVRGLSVSNPLSDPTGTNGNINIRPTFVDATNGNYHLPADSPLIDAGDNSAVLAGETDFDLTGRIYGGTVDIGFDEVAPTAFTFDDVAACLREAAGLLAAGSQDASRYNVEAPGGLDLLDALRLARKAAGMDPNP
jgi:hypothetical protein